MLRATTATAIPAVLRRVRDLLEGYLAALHKLSDRTVLELPRVDTGLVCLKLNQVRRITAVDGAGYLEVLDGTVWLTATPAAGDILLREGDGIELGSQWPVVVQALEPARIILLCRAPAT